VDDGDCLLIQSSRLAVALGLVYDRTQDIVVGRPVMSSYYSRANYGFLCVERYDKSRHLRADTYSNQLDGKLYVDNQIEWAVKKVSQFK
jgi:hypothetical protein